MSQSNFEELFNKFLGENMTAAEIDRFRELFHDDRYQPLRDQLLETAFTNKAFIETGDHDPKEVFQQLLARAKGREPETRLQAADQPQAQVIPLSPRPSPLRRLWIAAAVVFILLLGGTAWFFINHTHKGQVPVAQAATPKRDVAPGHNGAILTLSNGKKILLDSAGNGVLASNSGVAVIKKDGAIAYQGKTGEMVYNMVATPKGRQWQLTLSDGTRVWLNAGSSLRYPVSFPGKERLVEMTGEVYFEVAQNANAPFIVQTPKQSIQVLGTHFNVNAYGDEPIFRTTLLEGSVQVMNSHKKVVIKPGQQADNNYTTGALAVKDANVDDAIAWINGRFKFDNSDLKTVMRQIARWYDVEVEYRGNIPNSQFGGGTYRNNNLSEVLQVLELSGVHFKLEERKIIVTP
jgi:transmembrane sensor